ncbi:MAG: hypothetical protein GXO87_05115 [Chlorobi bacterium]|nr:hypothetical protein [Chlorobiota bacterium]
MKAIKLVVIFFVLVSAVWGQEETLVGGEIHNGGFGGPVIKMGQINDQLGLFIGGRGGWIINHSFVIGGGGYGLVNGVSAQVNAEGGEDEITMGYGGVEFEYIVNSNKLSHFTVYSLFGAGGYNYRNKYKDYDRNNVSAMHDSETFFVIEPAANLEINFTKFFRMSLGVGYRFVTGTTGGGFISDSDLSGFSGTIAFKFGRF